MKRALLFFFSFLIVGMMLFLSACGKDKNLSKPNDSSYVSENASETELTVDTDETLLDTTAHMTSATSTTSYVSSSTVKTNSVTSSTKKLSKEDQEKLKDEMNKIIDELMGDE